ncbi:flagellar hook-length control protein FliK [Neobacillus sp. LXY-1]|uniref:flagellar hook-length control protein FliK n=1 Tax=Neobacillus sp. LXY-1 TaxID=3379133 RepID=UPI003EE30B19
MDVTQTIKINQNNNIDTGKNKAADVQASSFDQILALFNMGLASSTSDQSASLQKLSSDTTGNGVINPLLNQMLNQVGPVQLPSSGNGGNVNQDVSETAQNIELGSTRADQSTITEQDWQQLEMILASLLVSLQQTQNSGATSPDGLNVSTSKGDEQKDNPLILNNVNELQEQLTKWFQKVNNSSSSSIDLDKVFQDISQLMNQTSDTNNLDAIQKEILQKIQTELHVTNFDSQIVNNQLKEPAMKTMDSSNRQLSLDKDQLFLTPNNGIQANQSLQNINHTVLQEAGTPSPVLTVSEFAPEISEWIGRFVKITDGPVGSTEAKFSLYPEHLGHVEVKITSQQGMVTAQIVTDTSMAKEALEGQLQQLKQSLQQQGIQLQKIDVVQTQTTSANQSSLSFAQNGHFNSQRDQRNHVPSQEDVKRKKNSDSSEFELNAIPNSSPSPYGGSYSGKVSVLDFTV